MNIKRIMTGIKAVDVEVINIDGNSAHVRALHGTPFTIKGSKPPYKNLMTDDTYVPVDEVMPNQDEDAALAVALVLVTVVELVSVVA